MLPSPMLPFLDPVYVPFFALAAGNTLKLTKLSFFIIPFLYPVFLFVPHLNTSSCRSQAGSSSGHQLPLFTPYLSASAIGILNLLAGVSGVASPGAGLMVDPGILGGADGMAEHLMRKPSDGGAAVSPSSSPVNPPDLPESVTLEACGGGPPSIPVAEGGDEAPRFDQRGAGEGFGGPAGKVGFAGVRLPQPGSQDGGHRRRKGADN